MIEALAVAAGLAFLVFGGDGLVRGAVGLAHRLSISPLVIGAVIVGLGTSAPELAASMTAALSGAPGLAVGNVAGSNIANILLVAGAGAALTPLATRPAAVGRDTTIMLGVTLLVMALLATGAIGHGAGAILALFLAVYIVGTIWWDRRDGEQAVTHEGEAELAGAPPDTLPFAIAFTAGGLIAVLAGAQSLVFGAVGLARDWGVSDTVIGLSVVAVGTSLPELAATLAAARRGQGAVAVGNVIGSNLFNLLGVLGLTALVTPLPTPLEVWRIDMWVMALAAAALAVFTFVFGRISRPAGAVLLGCYALYILSLAVGWGRA